MAMNRLWSPWGVNMLSAGAGSTAPSYWLVFDGSDDVVTLPAGEGKEPTTAITIEAWAKHPAALNQRMVIVRCGDGFKGYSLYLTPQTTPRLLMNLNLNGPTGDGQVVYSNNASVADANYPTHYAASWDGSFVYHFINGVLVSKVASSAGPITYTGTGWSLGYTPDIPGYSYGSLSQIRVSNACRYTANFTPPESFTSDANTVCLYECKEGAGTALADSGPGAHNGTFKAAGEPAWGAAITSYKTHGGDDLWTALLAIQAPLNDDIYINANGDGNRYVYRKISNTGPTWLKMRLTANVSVGFDYTAAWAVVGDPAGSTPDAWTSEAVTLYTSGSPGEQWYAISGQPTGGTSQWMGGIVHGNETMDTQGFYIDSVETTLVNGNWYHGGTVEYRRTSHFTDAALPGVDVCDIVTTATWANSAHYVRVNCQFTWNVTTAITSAYVRMMETNTTIFDQLTYLLAGTDYTFGAATGTQGRVRSSTAAVWKATNEFIMATYLPDVAASVLRYASGNRNNIQNTKNYCERAPAVGDAAAGQVWECDGYYGFWANAGNHVLKTT